MSFLEINKTVDGNIKKDYIINMNLITHIFQIDLGDQKCEVINLNHNNLAGYSVENIPREFTLCPKDNNKALNVLRMHKW